VGRTGEGIESLVRISLAITLTPARALARHSLILSANEYSRKNNEGMIRPLNTERMSCMVPTPRRCIALSRRAQAAIDTLKQWKYEPMTVNGVPKPIVFTVSVEFKR
jgi:hypothetical protein